MKFPILKKKANSGQVMLLTVLVISALFLGVTAIAGLLMNYQLRQVTNIVDATKAIFAADAAIERSLFVVYRCNSDNPVLPSGWPNELTTPAGLSTFSFCDTLPKQVADDPTDPKLPVFFNNATYHLLIESTVSGPGVHDSNANSSNVTFIKGAGQAGKSTRALGISF